MVRADSFVSGHGADELWSLVSRPGYIDAAALWNALAALGGDAELDYRSRLLVHESMDALATRWGADRLRMELRGALGAETLQKLWLKDFGEVGFPSLRTHLVDATKPDDIRRMLRELGQRLKAPAPITIGGSSALMLSQLIVRQTEDVDVVDELPAAIRAEPALVDELAHKHKLRLAHFASHYLPDGWEARTSSLGLLGKLDVNVIDPLDVLCGKLFSRRARDSDDLRAAWGRIDHVALRDRIRSSTARLRSDTGLAEAARQNWYVLTGEASLP